MCIRDSLKTHPHIRFAGQITGVEGYVESAAMGLLAGRMAAAEIQGRALPPPPPETAMGALVTHITGGAEAKTFQPMNVNFGLFPPIDAKGGRKGRKDRYRPIPTAPRTASPAGWRIRPPWNTNPPPNDVSHPLCPFANRAAASGTCLLRDPRP